MTYDTETQSPSKALTLTAKPEPVAELQQAGAKQYQPRIKKIARLWNEGTTLREKSAMKFIECAVCLRTAKEDMPPDDFTEMLRSGKLPFNEHKAYRLLKIASKVDLVANVDQLPPSWTVIYDLSKLESATIAAKMGDGSINPGMTAKDVAKLSPKPLAKVPAAGEGSAERHAIEGEPAKILAMLSEAGKLLGDAVRKTIKLPPKTGAAEIGAINEAFVACADAARKGVSIVD